MAVIVTHLMKQNGRGMGDLFVFIGILLGAVAFVFVIDKMG